MLEQAVPRKDNLSGGEGGPGSPPPPGRGLGTRVLGVAHDRRDLREDRADAGRDTGHDSAGSNGHETRHQSIFDEVLTARILPDFKSQNKIFHFLKFSSPFCCATGALSPDSKVSSAEFLKNQC